MATVRRPIAQADDLVEPRDAQAAAAEAAVVLLPPLLAEREEVAQPAVLNGVRVRLRPARDRVEKPLPNLPVIGM